MLHRTRTIFVSVLVSLLTACGGGGDGGTPLPTPDANPTGYYDNRGTGTLNSIPVTDLQGIIHNNRLMMLSAAQDLSYDGSITVTGNSFSGTLSVYFEGALQGTAPVTGTINQGTSVSGTLTGAGAGSGSFQLLYAASNSETAALSRVEDTTNPYWQGPIGGSASMNVIAINSAGNLLHAQAAFDGTFDGCNIYGTIAPIAATNLYAVTIVIDGGNLSAQAITLNTQTGIGSQAQALNTQTATLTIHNSANGVYLHNDQALNANITNRGDINLTNLGNLTIERLYANGEDFQSQGPYAGDVVLNVQGHINAYTGPGSHTVTAAPDIVAENLTVTAHGDFGNPARAMSILVNNTFAFFGQRGYVFYYGQRPQFTIGADDLVLFSGLTNLQGQQLIEIESLEDIDPAIFTAARNYYHEDVAILMPEDQRIDGVDEESEKERQGAPEVPQETQERGAEAQESNKIAP